MKIKPILGYEGIYTIDTNGNVFSINSNKFMKPYIDNGGYHRVQLSKDGVRKKYLVHRIVALAFIPNPDNKPEINHIDGDKSNNCVKNLEWCTRKENEQHSSMIGTKAYGEKNGRCKLKEADVLEIFKLRKLGIGYKKLGDDFGVERTTISSICNRKTWKHLNLKCKKLPIKRSNA